MPRAFQPSHEGAGVQLNRNATGSDTKLMVVPEKFERGMVLQLARFREALAGGMPRRGWKIGINVPEVLRHLGLPHPGVGWLDGRRVFSTGATLERPPDARLHVEPEVALSFSKAVPPGCSGEAARECISAVHPTLELLNYAQPGSGLDDVVAHCMFHDATILGPAASLEAAYDLGKEFPTLHVGDVCSDPPRRDLVPVDPSDLLRFVADYLAAFGQSLEPGDLLLSGSYLAKALPIEAGETAVAEFGPLGSVSVRIAA